MKVIATILFFLAVLGSLISQTPSLIETDSMQWLKFLWVLPFIFQIFIDSKAFVSLWSRQILFCLFLFFLYCLTFQIFLGHDYIAVNLQNICMSVTIALVSYSFWRRFGSLVIMKILCCILVFVGFFLAYSVYVNYLADFSILDFGYAFKNKNSMGQILLCCGYIALANYIPNRTFIKILYESLILFMFLIMIIMKARATIVCGLFILLYHIYKSKNRKLQFFIIALTLFLIGVVFIYQDLFDLVVTGIIFANNDIDDINSVSSNRVVLVSESIELLKDNYLMGIGDFYIDCMPIAMLLQFGIFGSFLVFFIIFIFGYHLTHNTLYKSRLSRTAYLLFCAFLINALFEAQPPFGPGAKCFLLWVVVGFTLAEQERNHLLEYN